MNHLRLTLNLAPTELAASEDPPCRYTVVNGGDVPVAVPNLDLNPDWPRFTVEALETGAVQSFDPAGVWAEAGVKPLAAREGDGAMVTLAPGASVDWSFQLSHRVVLPPPGRYRLQASFAVGDQPVRSAPIDLTVHPAEITRSTLAYTNAGFSDQLYEAWVDGRTRFLYLRGLRTGRRPGQVQCLRVGALDKAARPVLSVAPNGASAPSGCVVWLDGDVLQAVDVGAEAVLRPRRSLRVPGARFVLSPMWMDPVTGDTQALVWVGSGGGGLVPVRLEGSRLMTSGPAVLGLPEPLWACCSFPSSSERRGLFLSSVEGVLSLRTFRLVDEVLVAVEPLRTWRLGLMGIDAHLDADDTLRGVVVGQDVVAGSEGPVVYARWWLDGEGRFGVEAPRHWPGLDVHSLEHFQMSVDAAGNPHALIQSANGAWGCVTPGAHTPLAIPPASSTADTPFLCFSAGGVAPYVLWSDPARGRIVMPLADGAGPVNEAQPAIVTTE